MKYKHTGSRALSIKCERKKASLPSEIVIHVAPVAWLHKRIHENREKPQHAGTQTHRWAHRWFLSFQLSVITTDVLLCHFNISDSKRKNKSMAKRCRLTCWLTRGMNASAAALGAALQRLERLRNPFIVSAHFHPRWVFSGSSRQWSWLRSGW